MVAGQRLIALNEKLTENADFLARKFPADENFLKFMTNKFYQDTLMVTNFTASMTSDVIESQNVTSSCWFGCVFEGAEDVLTEIFTLFYKMKKYVYFCLVVIALILVCVLLNKIIKTFLYCSRFTVSKVRPYHCHSI